MLRKHGRPHSINIFSFNVLQTRATKIQNSKFPIKCDVVGNLSSTGKEIYVEVTATGLEPTTT